MKQIVKDCKISPAVFQSEDGRKIDYFKIVVVLQDEEISLFVKEKDKALFAYLAKRELENVEDFDE